MVEDDGSLDKRAEFERWSLTRRQALAAAVGGAGLLTLGEIFGPFSVQPAHAIAWNYPFTSYFNPGADFYATGDWWTESGHHWAMDIEAPRGEPIYACANGIVVANYFNTENALGWVVRVDHGSNISTQYAHLREQSTVATGSSVNGSSVIGYVGDSGGDYDDHLHVEMWAPDRANRINPALYIDYPLAPLAGMASPPMRRMSMTTRFIKAGTGTVAGAVIALAGDVGYPCPGNWQEYVRGGIGTTADRALYEFKVHGEAIPVAAADWETVKKWYTEGTLTPVTAVPTVSLSAADRALLTDIANRLPPLAP